MHEILYDGKDGFDDESGSSNPNRHRTQPEELGPGGKKLNSEDLLKQLEELCMRD